MRYILAFFLFGLSFSSLRGQGSYIPLGSYTMHILDRMEIKQGRLAHPEEFNTTTKAYLRGNIAHYADSFTANISSLSKADRFNLQYLQNDNFEYSTSLNTKSAKPLFGTGLYKHKAAFFDVNIPEFKLIVNPVVYFKLEYDRSQKEYNYINSRGIELRGQLGKRLSFYTTVSDEIQKLNSWNQAFYDQDSVIPGQAFLQSDDLRTFNYWLASGYIVFQPSKFIDIQFGQSRNFIGNGYRSLMISDFSRDNLFLRVNTRIWKINYTNIWGELLNYVKPYDYTLPTRHYFATTYANVNITKNLNIGMFQTISFQRDSGFAHTGYDLQYLNPIIFYKAVENGLNSPDKAILGGDVKYNFANHFSIYGQFVFSEFKFEKIVNRTGWYGNKQAFQLGLKYIDVLNIHNLDLQLEYNWIRPYMYTSYTPRNAYVNYNQNMAHPLGANLKENIMIVRYQPSTKLFVTAKAIIGVYGNDTMQSNWGKDIRLNYYEHEKEYGNTVAQGVTTHLYIAECTLSYMLWHNLFIDASVVYRKTKSVLSLFDTQTFNPSVAIRWNINYRGCDF
jgi:hypothetical protein